MGYQSEGSIAEVITACNNSDEKNAQFAKAKDVLNEKVTKDFWPSEVGCDHQYEMKISIVRYGVKKSALKDAAEVESIDDKKDAIQDLEDHQGNIYKGVMVKPENPEEDRVRYEMSKIFRTYKSTEYLPKAKEIHDKQVLESRVAKLFSCKPNLFPENENQCQHVHIHVITKSDTGVPALIQSV